MDKIAQVTSAPPPACFQRRPGSALRRVQRQSQAGTRLTAVLALGHGLGKGHERDPDGGREHERERDPVQDDARVVLGLHGRHGAGGRCFSSAANNAAAASLPS